MDFTKFETNVQNYTGAVKDRFLVINGNAVSINNRVDENTDNINSLIIEIAQLRQYVDEADDIIHNDITSTNNILSEVKNNVEVMKDNVDNWIASHTNEYDALVNVDSEINSSISDIKIDIADANSSISTLKSDITALNSWKESHTTQYNNLITANEEINSSISTLKSDVQVLINWKNTHESQYNELITKDSEIDSSISYIKTIIGTNEDTSTANTLIGMIKALNEQFNEYELVIAQALVDLDTRLKATE